MCTNLFARVAVFFFLLTCSGLFAQPAQHPASVDDCLQKITTKDDALEVSAILATRSCYVDLTGRIGMKTGDAYLRAFIHKKTGTIDYQFYAYFDYSSSVLQRSWRFFSLAKYEADNGPEQLPLTRVYSNVDCSQGSCQYREDVTFNLQPKTFVWAASRNVLWRYKLEPKEGDDFEQFIPPEEFQALKIAATTFVDRLGLPKPQEPAQVPISPSISKSRTKKN